MFDFEATEELLRSDDEDMDLDENAEEDIGKKELGAKAPEQQNEDISNARAASSIGYKVLYVHSGVKDCNPIKGNVFFKL